MSFVANFDSSYQVLLLNFYKVNVYFVALIVGK